MKTKLKLPVPCIHSNGSGERTLREQSKEAYRALQNALDAMRKCRPHGRDYYPLGDNALNEAQEAHRTLYAQVSEVSDAYFALGMDIMKAGK